ncbi:MAG: LysM peptidoglycan-binding domain-containing protein [Pseudomonadota bacterium]
MIKRFAGQALLVAGCLISSAYAEEAPAAAGGDAAAVAINPDHPTTYVVQPGDTLWGISEKFLVNPWQWPEVWHINEQVANPHLIYPGQQLRLVWKDGKPSLVVDTSTGSGVIGSKDNIVEVMADGKTYKLRPRIRESSYDLAIPAIPLKDIEVFLTDSRVVTLDEMKQAPYLLAGADKHVIMGRGDTVYAREQAGKQWDSGLPEYGVYRQGDPYIDPETKEFLGYEAKKIGAVRITEVSGDVATMRVLASSEDLRTQDRLLASDQRKVQSVFHPRPAPDGVKGRIVSVFGAIGSGARNSVVVLNRGARDNIAPGHVFTVQQKGEVVRDSVRGGVVALPPVDAGLVIVFRAFDRVSYALVTRASRPLTRDDIVLPPSIAAH